MQETTRAVLDEYVSKIRSADQAQIPVIRTTFSQWYATLAQEERDEIKPFWGDIKEKARQLLGEVSELLVELEQENALVVKK